MKQNEQISVTAPDEPGPGSVVLDRFDMAWQLRNHYWRACETPTPTADRSREVTRVVNWPTLLVLCGPLTLLRVVEAAE